MEAKRVLANRYELIRKIGSGGMAVVYQAYDTYAPAVDHGPAPSHSTTVHCSRSPD